MFMYFCNWHVSKYEHWGCVYTSYLRLRFRKFRCVMWSISSTFYARVFCTQFLAPKLQTQNTALQFLVPNFCTQKARVKRWWNWHLEGLTKVRSYLVCHTFRLTKRGDYFRVFFDHFWSERHFLGSWDSIENWLVVKTTSAVARQGQKGRLPLPEKY